MESVMSDIAFHRSFGGSGWSVLVWRFVARLARVIDRTLFAHRIRRDLDELSDRLRRDIGLIR